MADLYVLTGKVLRLKEMLEAEEIDNEAFNDTLQCLCVEEELNGAVKLLMEFQADSAAYDAEIKRFTAKKEEANKKIERLKSGLLLHLVRTKQQTVKTDLFTISKRKSEFIEVTDFEKLDAEFKRTKTTVEPDKNAIKAAIKAGKPIKGAELKEKFSLNIK